MKYLRIILPLCVSLISVQCSEEGDKTYPTTTRPNWEVTPEDTMIAPPSDWVLNQEGTDENPQWSLQLEGTAERPQWTAPDANEYPTSMTAVIRLTPFLEKYATEGDLLAAFIDNECRGVATFKQLNDIPLFFVQIKAKDTQEGNVSFHYYSQKNRTIFSSVASDVTYDVNKIYGTVEEPAFPRFEQSGKYPIYMNATIQLNPSTLPFDLQSEDKLAAFVGNECRGVATAVGTKPVYQMEIRGKKAGETVGFKYYSAKEKSIYRAEANTSMEALATFGTAENPQHLILVPESSMTAYVTIDPLFMPYTSTDDQVAAFVGTTCVGTGQIIDPMATTRIYKVVIKGVAGESEKINLKYYNHACGYFFETADFLSFASQGVYGTAEQPETAPLVLTGKHPLKMHVVCTLPQAQAQYVTDRDMLGAFVGNECRGMAKLSEKDGKKIFTLDINGSLSNDEQIVLKYYCTHTSYLYTANEFKFEKDKQWGTIDSPELLSVWVVVD